MRGGFENLWKLDGRSGKARSVLSWWRRRLYSVFRCGVESESLGQGLVPAIFLTASYSPVLPLQSKPGASEAYKAARVLAQ